MRLLCIGRDGQLARALLEQAEKMGLELTALGRPDVDLLQPDTLDRALNEVAPDIVINAAAYTNVDGAEQDEESAFALNHIAAERLAEATAAISVPLIHISTDYVFDGALERPYLETDPVAPTGIYGESKLAGEMAVAKANPHHVILRTAWLYSPFGKNFLKTMLRLAEMGQPLRVVNDQFGSPTSALDLAKAVLQICQQIDIEPDSITWGVYHAAARGVTNWADFAEAIFVESAALNGPTTSVESIPSDAYPSSVKRPSNSSLSCEKLSSVFGISLPQWQRSVRPVLAHVLLEKERL